jgi:mono/diheme cytochrome c family protein
MHRLIFLAITAAAMAAAQRGGTSATGSAANGKMLFTKVGCYECHGYAGQGGRAGARIASLPLKSEDLIRYVRRPAGEMPAYTDKVVSDRQLEDIYAYLQSMPRPKSVQDIPLLNRIKNRQ